MSPKKTIVALDHRSHNLLSIVIHTVIIFFILPDLALLENNATKIPTTRRTTHPPSGGEAAKVRIVPQMNHTALEIMSVVEHTASLIFLHDFNETGEKWREQIEKIVPPYMRIVIPTANDMLVQWKGYKLLPSWFVFDEHNGYPRIPNGTEHHMVEAAWYIHYLVMGEVKKNIPAQRVVIGGVNQGGVVALQAALTYNDRLGGCFTLSSWDLHENSLRKNYAKQSRRIPYFQTWCEGNNYTTNETQINNQKLVKEYLKHKNVTYQSYPGNTKTVPKEWEDVKNFLHKHIQFLPNCVYLDYSW